MFIASPIPQSCQARSLVFLELTCRGIMQSWRTTGADGFHIEMDGSIPEAWDDLTPSTITAEGMPKLVVVCLFAGKAIA